MPVDQSTIQTMAAQQGGAQPATGGAVAPVFSEAGNPNTAYNVPPIPPQASAAGQWWAQPAAPASPVVQALINQSYGRTYPNIPTVPTPPPTTTTPPPTTVTPPVVTPPVVAPPTTTHPNPDGTVAEGSAGYGQDREAGGDGAWCVAEDMYLEGGLQANEIELDFATLCHTPEGGFHEGEAVAVGEPVLQECVELITQGGARLVCSVTTPFTFVGASKDLADNEWAHAPDMVGKLVYVLREDQLVTEQVVMIAYKGPLRVVPIDFGGKSFPAGANANALIYSHNIRKLPGSGVDLIGLRESISQQFGISWGDTDYITTSGQLAGMNPTQASAYAGGQSYQPGGANFVGDASGFGEWWGTGAGLAAAGAVDPAAPFGATEYGVPIPPPANFGGGLAPEAPVQAPSNLPPTPEGGGALPATKPTNVAQWLWNSAVQWAKSAFAMPKDRDGTIDWGGFFLQLAAGAIPVPGASLIVDHFVDTGGAAPPPPAVLPNINYGPN